MSNSKWAIIVAITGIILTYTIGVIPAQYRAKKAEDCVAEMLEYIKNYYGNSFGQMEYICGLVVRHKRYSIVIIEDDLRNKSYLQNLYIKFILQNSTPKTIPPT
jgi:hypothetical protein